MLAKILTFNHGQLLTPLLCSKALMTSVFHTSSLSVGCDAVVLLFLLGLVDSRTPLMFL